MFPKMTNTQDKRASRHRQTGLGLVSAIFVITVLAVIIAGMVRFFSTG